MGTMGTMGITLAVRLAIPLGAIGTRSVWADLTGLWSAARLRVPPPSHLRTPAHACACTTRMRSLAARVIGMGRCAVGPLRSATFQGLEPLVALRPSPLVSALGTRVRIFENGVEPSAARCVDCGGIPAVVASTSIPGADIIPDFMVVGPQIAHQGAGGVLAMGFWDNFWQWSPAVSFAKC